jgi:hypothetical protein
MKDFQSWLERVKVAASGQEVFQIVDEFRPGDWTDEERALMSKTYIGALSRLAPETLIAQPEGAAATVKTPAASTDDQEAEQKEQGLESASEPDEMSEEEVWYEKM